MKDYRIHIKLTDGTIIGPFPNLDALDAWDTENNYGDYTTIQITDPYAKATV